MAGVPRDQHRVNFNCDREMFEVITKLKETRCISMAQIMREALEKYASYYKGVADSIDDIIGMSTITPDGNPLDTLPLADALADNTGGNILELVPEESLEDMDPRLR